MNNGLPCQTFAATDVSIAPQLLLIGRLGTADPGVDVVPFPHLLQVRFIAQYFLLILFEWSSSCVFGVSKVDNHAPQKHCNQHHKLLFANPLFFWDEQFHAHTRFI